MGTLTVYILLVTLFQRKINQEKLLSTELFGNEVLVHELLVDFKSSTELPTIRYSVGTVPAG